MLRIVSPQKAAHNEILVKRQQFNFQCVCPMLTIISPQKAAHHGIDIGENTIEISICVFVLC